MKTLAQEILSELYYSQNHGTVVGLRLKDNDQLIVSAVISIQGNLEFELEDTSIYGNKLSRNHFVIDEIAGILRFKARYHDPEFVKLRSIKNTILVLKEERKAKVPSHRVPVTSESSNK